MISNAFGAVLVQQRACTRSCGGSRPRYVSPNFFVWSYATSCHDCITVALGVTCNPVVRRDCGTIVKKGRIVGGTNPLGIIDKQNNVDPLRRAMESMLILCCSEVGGYRLLGRKIIITHF